MNNPRVLILVALAVAILCGVAGFAVLKRTATRHAALQAAKLEQADLAQAKAEAGTPVVETATPTEVVAEEASAARETAPQPKPVPAGGQSQNASAAAQPGKSSAKEPVKDPVARIALAYVGADPEASAYWYGAINNPSLSGHERQDLIEDLNEDGLSDPKHPTADDLPLIVNRLRLIEVLWPEAMDEVNADAFQEAYKDLVNLAAVAMGGGNPVR